MTRPRFDISLLPETPDLRFEQELWSRGIHRVAGIDEAGRGALAGPVAAATVILPEDPRIQDKLKGVRDSKQMTPKERDYWAKEIHVWSLDWGVGFSSHQEVDNLGIVPATRKAVQRALENLQLSPQHLLIDYLELPDCSLPQTPLVKGDARSLSIASASVLAKTVRDALMCQLDSEYPGYGFAVHKGYGTTAHRQALERLGPSPVHRLTFSSVARKDFIYSASGSRL